MDYFAEPIQLAGQKCLLGVESERFQGVHRRDRLRLSATISGDLIIDNEGRAAGSANVRQHHALLKLTNDRSRHPQWVDESPLATELHEVETAKRGGILILSSPANP